MSLNNNQLRSIASIGGFSSIQDESQVNTSQINSENLNTFPSCLGGQCCWLGVCLRSNKITYLIDSSYYMHEDYLETTLSKFLKF